MSTDEKPAQAQDPDEAPAPKPDRKKSTYVVLAILLGVVIFGNVIGPPPSNRARPDNQAAQRARFTNLRPDLDSATYWTARCAPYLHNLAKIEASTYHGLFDHEQDLARGAWDVCKQNQFIEDNGSGPDIRDIYEKPQMEQAKHQSKLDKVFTAIDAGLIAAPPQPNGQPAVPVHVASDGCDMAGAMPNCKEEMAKLIAGRR